MNTQPTAVIAEDEPILRAQLKGKLARLWPELHIVADVGDGGESEAEQDESTDENRGGAARMKRAIPKRALGSKS